MCNFPFTKKDGVVVPCGRCSLCRKRKVSGWVFRLQQEQKRSCNALFITLTYDTLHVPISKKGFKTLQKRDLQLFFKRLRKRHKNSLPIKYYAVGEYGSQRARPHYHIIGFNIKPELIALSWRDEQDKPIGNIHIGKVNNITIAYTLKYVCKVRKVPHANDDRVREFSLCSKHLGENYLTAAMIQYHKDDPENRAVMTNRQGFKVSMPRYYKDKIFNKQERELIAAAGKKKADQDFKDLVEKLQKQCGDLYAQKLEERKQAAEDYYFKSVKQKRQKI